MIRQVSTAGLHSMLGRSLQDLVSEGRATCIATGLRWGEGPAYFAARGVWVFSDIPNNRMLSWSRRDGLGTFRAPSNFANGNTLGIDGALLTCEHGTRRVTRTEPDGSYSVLCGQYEGRK